MLLPLYGELKIFNSIGRAPSMVLVAGLASW